jgi:hypothetical protein
MRPYRGLFSAAFDIVRRNRGHNKRDDQSDNQLNVVAGDEWLKNFQFGAILDKIRGKH